jgi:hypothetical protein
MLVYNLACSESLSGHTADAIDHLRSAIGASEKLCADAREDSDFDPIRDEPSFNQVSLLWRMDDDAYSRVSVSSGHIG